VKLIKCVRAGRCIVTIVRELVTTIYLRLRGIWGECSAKMVYVGGKLCVPMCLPPVVSVGCCGMAASLFFCRGCRASSWA
jgi:hypothetical protein